MPQAIELDLADRASLMGSLPKDGIGAEIGVAEGTFSQTLIGVCKPRKLYLIDPWKWIESEALREDSSNVPQECQDGRFRHVCEKFKPNASVFILKRFSLDAVATFPDEYFDWVYIDADHTQAREDAEAWWQKVKPGGWLTGHDYTLAGGHITVKTDVDSFVADHDLELFVTRGDTDIYEKNYPSWAVQKEEDR